MGNQNQDINPLEELNLIIQKWYVLILSGILGGLLGYGASTLLAPRYEARATLQVNLDLPQTQVYTDAQTDYILSSAIQIIQSTHMIQQLVTGFQTPGNEIQSDDFHLERRESHWDLVVRNEDPELAAEMVNAWLDQSVARLDEARAHSVRAAGIATQLELLKGCLTSQVQPLCGSFSDAGQLDALLAQLWEQYQQEELASQGLNPSLTFLVEVRASIPASPVIHQRNTLILAGMGLGLLLGLPAIQFYFGKRR